MEPNDPRRRRTLLVALAVALLFLGSGLYLVLVSESDEDRVEATIDRLVTAVETRNPRMLAANIHDDFATDTGDKATVVAGFERAIEFYESASIKLRRMKVVVEGDEATATFEWSENSVFRTETYGRVDTSFLKDSWEPATARFRRDGEGRWFLLGIETRLPRSGR